MNQPLNSRSADIASDDPNQPQVEWKGGEFHVSLPDLMGNVIEANWKPSLTYVIRLREAGTEEWGPGFCTPFTKCDFVDLKPDTDYEAQITAKNEAGEGEPAITPFRTAP